MAREVMVDLIAEGDLRSPEGGAPGMVVTPLSIKWWFSGLILPGFHGHLTKEWQLNKLNRS